MSGLAEMLVHSNGIRAVDIVPMLVDPLVGSLGFYLSDILLGVALKAESQIDCVLGPTVGSMAYFQPGFSGCVREEAGRYHVVAALAVCPAQAGGATASLVDSFSDDPFSADSCFPNPIPEVAIPFVADDGFILKFGFDSGVYL